MLKFLHVDTPTLFEVCVPLAPRHLRGDRIGVTALLQSLMRRPSPSTISLSSSDPHGILQDLHQVPSLLHGDRRTLLPLSLYATPAFSTSPRGKSATCDSKRTSPPGFGPFFAKRSQRRSLSCNTSPRRQHRPSAMNKAPTL